MFEMGKPLRFLGSSRTDLRGFPDEARELAGRALRLVQLGRMPPDWKPLPAVGPGACEIRIHLEGEWRVVYVAKFQHVVYVLHSFQRKSQTTALRDIRLARERYKAIGGRR